MTRQLYTIHPGIGQQAIDYRGKETGSRERNRFFFLFFSFFSGQVRPRFTFVWFLKMCFEKPSYYTTLRTLEREKMAPPTSFSRLLLLLMLSFKHLFCLVLLSFRLPKLLPIHGSSRPTEKKTQSGVEQTTTEKKMCPVQSKHTCVWRAFYIFLLQALSGANHSPPASSTLYVHLKLSTYFYLCSITRMINVIFWKKEPTKKKKKKEFTCVQTGSGRVKLGDQHFRVGLFVVSFSFIITKEKKNIVAQEDREEEGLG